VTSLIDLKGRKVALGGGKESTQGYFTELLLRTAGMTLDDLEIVNLNFADALAALANKSVDAAFLPDPFKAQARQKGIAVSIARVGVPGRSGVTTLFGAKFIAQRPEAANALMLALVRGARDLQGSGVKLEDNLAAVSKYTKIPIEALRTSDPYEYDPNLAPDVETILGMQQLFLNNHQLGYAAPLPIERLIDGSFSRYAGEKLGGTGGKS